MYGTLTQPPTPEGACVGDGEGERVFVASSADSNRLRLQTQLLGPLRHNCAGLVPPAGKQTRGVVVSVVVKNIQCSHSRYLRPFGLDLPVTIPLYFLAERPLDRELGAAKLSFRVAVT